MKLPKRLLIGAAGIVLIAGVGWGAWEAVSGWKETKDAMAVYDSDAERTAATNDSLQTIIKDRDASLKEYGEAAAARQAERKRQQRLLEERARVQAQASREAADVLDTHLAARSDSVGLALHAQEKALTNAERLTWRAEKASLVASLAEEHRWRDSIQTGYDQLWTANDAAQDALVKATKRGDKWKQAAKPTIGKVLKRTILPVAVAVGVTMLLSQVAGAATGG